MLGLFENLARKVGYAKVSIEGALAAPICDVKNYIVEKQYEKKHQQYQKAIEETKAKGEWQGVDDEGEENPFLNEDVALYMELLQRVAQHEEVGVRNPVDIAIELGYSEDDVKEAFEYLQKKLEVVVENNADNHNKSYFLGNTLCTNNKTECEVKKGGGFFGNYVVYDQATTDAEEEL